MQCHSLGQAKSMVHTVCDSYDGLKGSAKTGTKLSSESCAMEGTKTILCTWIEDWNQCHVLVSKVLVEVKAHFIYENLPKHDGNAKPFNL